MSPEGLDRRRFLRAAGGVGAGALAATYLADPAHAASVPADVSVPGDAADTTGNPVITNIYTADPDAFVFDGRFYLDTDRDQAPLGANDFVMRDWHVYSTTDMVEWTDHGVRLALTDFTWANRNAWAPQMIHRDGTFYWYMPVQKAATGGMTIAVAVGTSPLGPFHDALGHPLIDETVANHSSFDIDPTVLIDDDGQAYIYWGSFSSPRAAKLRSNMIELAELDPGTGGRATGNRVPGRVGNAVKLNGSSEYVSLPTGIVSGLNDFTIATWVNPAATSTWSRVFDFGSSTTNYMFLAVSAGNGPRFAITTTGNGAEQQLNRPGQLPLNTWTHLAVTLSGNTSTFYVNGVAVATNTAMTLRPSGLGATTKNYLGRSQFADPFLNATIDDFHIHDRALGAAEIQALAAGGQGSGTVAAYRFDEASGADALDFSGNGRTATIISPPVNVITPQGLTGYWEAPFLFKRNGIYYLAYARGNPATGGNPATIDYATATNPFGPWTYRGRVLDTVTNTTTNHSAIVEYNGQWYIVYHNGMLTGGGEFRRSVCVDKLFFNDDGTIQKVVQTLSPAARQPVVRYALDDGSGSIATDSTANGFSATLVNGPTWVPGVYGGGLALDGTNQHLRLPTGLLWNMYDFTIALWVKLNPTTGTAHVFDFGTSPTSYLYLAVNPGTAPRFAISTNGTAGEQRINGTATLPAGRWTHLAVTKSALLATLYIDGVPVGQNTNLGLYPARLGNTPNTWIGRSQNAADPFLNAALDDIHIFQRGLSAAELRDLVVTGLIVSLEDYVAGQPIGGGAQHPLTVKLVQVSALLRGGHPTQALAALNNDFVGLVNDARSRSLLTDTQAAELLRSAALISSTITANMS